MVCHCDFTLHFFSNGLSIFSWALRRECVQGGFVRPVGAERVLEAWGRWRTGAGELQMGRPAVCRNVLLILLAPFVPVIWAQAMCPGTRYSDPTSRPECLDRATAHSREVEGDISNGAYRSLQPGEFLQSPGSPCGSPVFSIQPLSSLLYRTWST